MLVDFFSWLVGPINAHHQLKALGNRANVNSIELNTLIGEADVFTTSTIDEAYIFDFEKRWKIATSLLPEKSASFEEQTEATSHLIEERTSSWEVPLEPPSFEERAVASSEVIEEATADWEVPLEPPSFEERAVASSEVIEEATANREVPSEPSSFWMNTQLSTPTNYGLPTASRLENHLLTLAQQYAPRLLVDGWANMEDQNKRLPSLARQLATYGLLVIQADPGTPTLSEAFDHLQHWMYGYANFYQLLTQTLFTSKTGLGAKYADDKMPVIMMLQGKSTHVIEVMAGFLAPYIVRGQQQSVVAETEIIGLMNIILTELEATDLPSHELHRLAIEGAALIERMLTTIRVRQLPLTRFDRDIFTQTGGLDIPKRPATLPEIDKAFKFRLPTEKPQDTTHN